MKDERETVVYKGRIGEIVQTVQTDGRVFEQYRRTPGVRIIIISPERKVLITREMRHELGYLDLRLPGGKVCDTLGDYEAARENNEDFSKLAGAAAVKETLEETGLRINDLKFLTKANAGATVGWDLYYFLVTDYTDDPSGQQLEIGEEIEVSWMTSSEIKAAITDGKMSDWRSVGVLLGLVLPTIE